MQKLLPLYAGALALFLMSPLTHSATLTEVWAQAYANDPELAANTAHRSFLLEAKPQALAALLPHLDADGGYVLDRTTGNFLYVLPQGLQSASQVIRSTTPQWDLVLHQSLFSWEAISRYREAGLVSTQAEVQFQGAVQSAMLRASKAYFAVLAAHDALAVTRSECDALAQEVKTNETRLDLGTATRTDVESARAAAAQAQASAIADAQHLTAARRRLAELTGSAATELAGPQAELPLTPPNPDNAQAWVEAASLQSSTINVARLSAQVAGFEVSATRAEHYPRVDLVASRSGANATASETLYGVTSPANNTLYDRQIGIEVHVPIFSGGKAASDVRQAKYAEKERLADLDKVTLDTQRRTEDAYFAVLADIARIKALRQSVVSSELALKGEKAGYEAGARTMLEVLISQELQVQAERNWIQSRYDYLIDELTLHYEAGDLDEGTLKHIDAALGPRVSLE